MQVFQLYDITYAEEFASVFRKKVKDSMSGSLLKFAFTVYSKI